MNTATTPKGSSIHAVQRKVVRSTELRVIQCSGILADISTLYINGVQLISIADFLSLTGLSRSTQRRLVHRGILTPYTDNGQPLNQTKLGPGKSYKLDWIEFLKADLTHLHY